MLCQVGLVLHQSLGLGKLMRQPRNRPTIVLLLSLLLFAGLTWAQQKKPKAKGSQNNQDARNKATGKSDPPEDPAYRKFGIYENTAPRAAQTEPTKTSLPLEIKTGSRIALVGNTLLERAQFFGHFESLLHQRYPGHNLVVRNLAWSADTPDIQVRPANFADLDQHLTHEKTLDKDRVLCLLNNLYVLILPS